MCTDGVETSSDGQVGSQLGVGSHPDMIGEGDILKLLLCRLPPASAAKLVNNKYLLVGENVQALLVATTSLHTRLR